MLMISSNCEKGTLKFISEIQLDTLILLDADYLKNRLFFIDQYYKSYYESGYSDDLIQWFYNPSHEIIKLELFKSASYADMRAVNTLASIHPDKYQNIHETEFDNIDIIPGQISKSLTVPLELGKDYEYYPKRGIIFLYRPIKPKDLLGVSFETAERIVGEFYESITDTTDVLSIQLIADKVNQPNYTHIWPLTLRNAYLIPDSIFFNDQFEMKIGYYIDDQISFSQTEAHQSTYMNLLGLDVIDINGNVINGGDGHFDKSSCMRLFDIEILIFPGINPFNPELESRFQLSISNRANIYNSEDVNIIYNNSRFKIYCLYK